MIVSDKVKDNVQTADFFLNCYSHLCKELFCQGCRKWYFVSTLSNRMGENFCRNL